MVKKPPRPGTKTKGGTWLKVCPRCGSRVIGIKTFYGEDAYVCKSCGNRFGAGYYEEEVPVKLPDVPSSWWAAILFMVALIAAVILLAFARG